MLCRFDEYKSGKGFKWLPEQLNDRSKVDYQIAWRLMEIYGFQPNDAAAVLHYASEKAEDRGIEYVVRTVSAACR
mgnify:CR=1 FL=1